MGLYSDGASRPSFVHPRAISPAGPARRPTPCPADQWWGTHHASPLSASQPATARPETWWSAASSAVTRTHADDAGRVEEAVGVGKLEQASGPPILPNARHSTRRRARHWEGTRAKARAAASPFLPPSPRRRASAFVSLCLELCFWPWAIDRGTWNGPGRPSWRGTRPPANKPNAFRCCR